MAESKIRIAAHQRLEVEALIMEFTGQKKGTVVGTVMKENFQPNSPSELEYFASDELVEFLRSKDVQFHLM